MIRSYIKNFFFTVIIYLTLVNCAMSANNDLEKKTVLAFYGLTENYNIPNKIEFSLYSNADKNLFFYCAVEKKIGGNWREIVPSIDATKVSKAAKLTKIEPNQSHHLTWNYKKQTFYSGISPGVFRFKITFFEDPEKSTPEKIYSDEFELLTQR